MTPEHLFADTNVLVYSALPATDEHQRVRALLDKFSEDGTQVWISRQVLREFCRVMLMQQEFGKPISKDIVVQRAEALMRNYMVAEDRPEVTATLLKLIEIYDFPARNIHDANIVATMRVYGIGTLLTNDRDDFGPFSDLIEIVGIGPD